MPYSRHPSRYSFRHGHFSITKQVWEIQHDETAAADVNKEITSEHNKRLVIHESAGYEPENPDKFNTLKKFIEERSKKDRCLEKLHAIWCANRRSRLNLGIHAI
jgi:hypothetical protein